MNYGYGPYRYRRAPLGNRRQDWINLILGIWLFISPWVLQFGSGVAVSQPVAGAPGGPIHAVHHAAWNAWVLGVIVGLVALSALSRVELWEEWLNLLLGAWIFASPWALGFAGVIGAASWDHWVVGALVFLVSASNLSAIRHNVPIEQPGPP
ncbi:MAG TPA: SPW repeat protein [Acetobacteraceae bacterium]|nr:SPW repeat protein [Acetobacteraceae bacterium]